MSNVKYIRNTKNWKRENKLQDAKRSMKRRCPTCQHLVSFYAFERDKKCCVYCGTLLFRNEKIAKQHQEIVKKRKRENFKREFIKYLEGDKDDSNNRTKFMAIYAY